MPRATSDPNQSFPSSALRRKLLGINTSSIGRQRLKYSHLGVPTRSRFDGEIDLPHLRMTVSDHRRNPFGIQLQRYWEDAPYPELVKTVPHVAFEVENLSAALEGQQIIIHPNSPSKGLLVAFIEVDGVPVELMQFDSEENSREMDS